jgi:hypothetical protein
MNIDPDDDTISIHSKNDDAKKSKRKGSISVLQNLKPANVSSRKLHHLYNYFKLFSKCGRGNIFDI